MGYPGSQTKLMISISKLSTIKLQNPIPNYESDMIVLNFTLQNKNI